MSASDQNGSVDAPARAEERNEPAARPAIELDHLAHELRTPLAAIQSMAEALSSGVLGRIENERHAGYVQTMGETARHALAVVDAMLVRQMGEAAIAPASEVRMDIAELAGGVVEGMSVLAARAGVRLAMSPAVGPSRRAKAKETDVRRMLINLVSNGISHAGGGATVTLSTGADEGAVWMTVADNGPGIPEAIVASLTRGERIEDAGEAPMPRPRLGLMLTQTLVAANGGQLELKSTSEGTEARIVLPAEIA